MSRTTGSLLLLSLTPDLAWEQSYLKHCPQEEDAQSKLPSFKYEGLQYIAKKRNTLLLVLVTTLITFYFTASQFQARL